MGRYLAVRGASLLRAALFVMVATTPLIGGEALARVGVTSAADGDPLGKPPDENERVLRIGIDVQANELITTAAKDRAHLVFLDGSSLTVGPNARLVIDKFVYDPNTKKGELAINASKGVFRLVGGKISKSNAITITTPSSTIGIRGGITILDVNSNGTNSKFVFGNSMTVTAGGVTQTATRAGSEVITKAGSAPGTPTLMKQGSLNADLGQLEGANSSSNNSADQSAQNSGFSSKNSGQPANPPNFSQTNPPNPTNNTLTNAVSNSNPASQPVGNSTPTTTTTSTNNTSSSNPSANANANPNPNANANPNANPVPNPNPTRTSQTLNGYVGGLIDQQGGEHHSRSVALLSQPGDVSITTDAANNQAKGTIVIRGLNGSHHSSITTLQLGGIGGAGAANSKFVDDKTYAVSTQHNDPSRLSTLRTGESTHQLNDSTALASAKAAQIPLPGNPGACTCEYLSWGWWTSSMPDPRHEGKTKTVTLGTYVVGTLTTAVQMPQTGSATYNGFMAGTVNNRGSTYLASGSYQNAWNFAARSGNFNGTFDGRGYSGTTQATAGSGGTNFTGSFSGGRRTGSLAGSFFASPSDVAKYQAGGFQIGNNHSHYKASGIFAGQRN